MKKPNLFQLSPLIVFVGLFAFLALYYPSTDITASGFTIFSCVMAIIFALFTFTQKTSLNEKINVFLQGASDSTVTAMCFIFIFSTVFSHILTLIGGVDSAVKLGLFFIPAKLILPGLFIITSIFATTIGTSMGSIAAFMPIALGFGNKLGINPALICGLIIGSSMLGDNLSVISDTTIAATKSTGSRILDKFKMDLRLVIPSAIITIIILTFINQGIVISNNLLTVAPVSILDVLKISPYFIVLTLALMEFDVLAVLVFGSIIAGILGLFLGSFTFLESTGFIFDGFYQQKGMVQVLILVMLIAGLSKIVEHNGGIDYLLHKFDHKIKTKAHGEFFIALLVFLVDAAIAINTVAILVTAPVAKKIGQKLNIPNKKVAHLLAIFSCIGQGLFPYTPQLLLAGAFAKISTLSILPYLHYQYITLFLGLLFIVKTKFTDK